MSDNKIVELLDEGQDVHITLVPKRMDGPNGRDFYLRYVWESNSDTGSTRCPWEGYESAEECITLMHAALTVSPVNGSPVVIVPTVRDQPVVVAPIISPVQAAPVINHMESLLQSLES